MNLETIWSGLNGISGRWNRMWRESSDLGKCSSLAQVTHANHHTLYSLLAPVIRFCFAECLPLVPRKAALRRCSSTSPWQPKQTSCNACSWICLARSIVPRRWNMWIRTNIASNDTQPFQNRFHIFSDCRQILAHREGTAWDLCQSLAHQPFSSWSLQAVRQEARSILVLHHFKSISKPMGPTTKKNF